MTGDALDSGLSYTMEVELNEFNIRVSGAVSSRLKS